MGQHRHAEGGPPWAHKPRNARDGGSHRSIRHRIGQARQDSSWSPQWELSPAPHPDSPAVSLHGPCLQSPQPTAQGRKQPHRQACGSVFGDGGPACQPTLGISLILAHFGETTAPQTEVAWTCPALVSSRQASCQGHSHRCVLGP